MNTTETTIKKKNKKKREKNKSPQFLKMKILKKD